MILHTTVVLYPADRFTLHSYAVSQAHIPRIFERPGGGYFAGSQYAMSIQ